MATFTARGRRYRHPRHRTESDSILLRPPSMQQPLPVHTDLPGVWRALAQQQRSLGADAQARTLEWCADQLEAAFRRSDHELLSLHRAAQESGYSTDHLGRLLREGKIPNSGRKSKPMIRRIDLPHKWSEGKGKPCIARHTGYNPSRLVRNIIHSKFGGGDVQDQSAEG